MKEIGGYLELEINDLGSLYHDSAYALNSGRNALQLILENANYSKIYIPYFTCYTVLQPIEKLGLSYEFYTIDRYFHPQLEQVREGEVILINNYFGVLDSTIKKFKAQYKNIIVDNCQAYYTMPLSETSTFYSARKFFGVPDGGFLYSEKPINLDLERSKSINNMDHLLLRIEKGANAGYQAHKDNDDRLDDAPVKYISKLTERLLRGVAFDKVKEKRTQNFWLLHEHLANSNELSSLLDKSTFDCPMVYPYLKKGNQLIREELLSHKIYTPIYWPNVADWCAMDSAEYYLMENLIALPLDQRYGSEEMKTIINKIKALGF